MAIGSANDTGSVDAGHRGQRGGAAQATERVDRVVSGPAPPTDH
jgi:hypothetical protein